MTMILVKRMPGNVLVPIDDAQKELCERFSFGKTLRAEVTQMRNEKFFRKWWALVKVAYDLWEETTPQNVEYRGMKVLPNFDRFRKDVTVLAGYYKAFYNVRGETRLEAESIAWGNMSEDRFEKLYSATISVILQSILPNRGLDEKQLQEWADRVLEFS